MGIQEAVITCLTNYVSLDGRASRAEFWWWVLFVLAGWIILLALGGAILGADSGAGSVSGGMFGLAMLLPTIAVAARRLHDTERSGWWLWLLLLPFVGWAVLAYLLVQAGTRSSNWYGEETDLS